MQERKIHKQNKWLHKEEQTIALSMKEVVQCCQLATMLLIVIPRNGAISGTPCWFLLLEDLAHSKNRIQVSHCEWKSMLLSP